MTNTNETATTPSDRLIQAARYLAGHDQDFASSRNNVGYNGSDSTFGHWVAGQRRIGTEGLAHKILNMLSKYEKTQLAGVVALPTFGELTAEYQAARPQGFTSVATSAVVSRPQATATIHLDGAQLVWSRQPYDATLKESVKALSGARYHAADYTWRFGASAQAAATLIAAFPDFTIAPEVHALARQAANEVKREAQTKQAVAQQADARTTRLLAALGDLTQPLAGGKTLFKHQQVGVRWLIEQTARYRGVINGDDMGLGKSLQAALAAKAYHLTEDCRVIIVAPASLRDNWLREVAQVELPVEVYSWAKIPDPFKGRYVVIADEAHYAQTLKSARTQRFLTLAKGSVATFMLSGTPIKNGRPVNLFPLLLAGGHPLSYNKRNYEVHFCDARQTKWSPWDTTGAANLDELHHETKDFILRRMKKQCLDLPAKTRVFQPAEVSTAAAKAYSQTLTRLRGEYADRREIGKAIRAQWSPWFHVVAEQGEHAATHIWGALTGRLEASQKAIEAYSGLAQEGLYADALKAAYRQTLKDRGGADEGGEALVFLGHLRHAGSIAKTEYAIKLAQDIIEGGAQVILFTEYEASAREIAHTLEAETIIGATPNDDRQPIVDRFQAGTRKAIVCSTKAGGVGITLTAGTYVIMVDRPWTPGDALQAEDRAYRIGQNQNVTVYWLQYGEVDAKVDKILVEKAERINKVLQGERKTLRGVNLDFEALANEILAAV